MPDEEPEPLSRATKARLEKMFASPDRDEAARLLLERCGRALPLMRGDTAAAVERIRIAAIKVSAGNIDTLRRAVELANVDWRDLLVEAGFENDASAHKRWHADG